MYSGGTAVAFSEDEIVYVTFTPTFNGGILIDGEALRIIYEYAPTIADMQLFVDDEGK